MPDLEERVAALEAAMAALEPDFMTRTTVEPLEGHGALTVLLTYEPAGVTVAARDRAEGICRLRRALADRARRDYDLQWKAKVAEARKAGRETPVKRGSDCPEHGGTLLWLGNGDLMCLQGHFYRLPEPPGPATEFPA